MDFEIPEGFELVNKTSNVGEQPAFDIPEGLR